jgi:hypothetical protein
MITAEQPVHEVPKTERIILSVLLSWAAVGVFMTSWSSDTDVFPALLDNSG